MPIGTLTYGHCVNSENCDFLTKTSDTYMFIISEERRYVNSVYVNIESDQKAAKS